MARLTAIELDQQLALAAYAAGYEDAVRGKTKRLYFLEQHQADYEIGYNRGKGIRRRY